jgi:type VI secretion system protein ImpG
MLPYTSRTFIGYRLLMEYFHFPEKFLFFECQGLGKISWPATNTVQLEFHFKEPQPLLTKHLNVRWFMLGCTPIVNLFPYDLEPFKLTYDKTDYPLNPEASRISQTMEVHTIQRVLGIDEHQQGMEYLPLYGKQYNTDYPLAGYWYAHRRENMFLSIIDPVQRPNITVCIKALCTNSHLPSELPVGGDEPRLQHEQAYARSLVPLTPVRGLYQADAPQWQLISHLATHYVSLSQGGDTLQNLRNILQLYDVNHNEQSGLLHLSSEPATYRSLQSRGTAFRQGVHLTLVVDETKFISTNLYFFGCILERFLALYVVVEGFTQLSIITHDKKTQYQWRPRGGEQQLT